MRPLAVLAVDDEPPALEDLTYLLRGDRRIGQVLAAGSSDEALRLLERRDVDAVFLDIRMPGLDGLDLVRVLNRFARPPHVVFVTAHEDFAVDAFALKACDYLLKPVGRERLAEAIRRVAALIEADAAGTGGDGGPGASGPGGVLAAGGDGAGGAPGADRTGPGGFAVEPGGLLAGASPAGFGPGAGSGGFGPGFVGTASGTADAAGPGAGAGAGVGLPGAGAPGVEGRGDHREERIPVDLGGVTRFVSRDDVAYAEAWGDYVRLHTAGHAPLVRVPLALLEDRWAPYGFLRIHRGYLVSLRHVEELRSDAGRWTIRVGGAELPVSRRHSRELRDRLVRWTPGPDGGPA